MINSQTLDELRSDLTQALKAIEDKYNMSIELGNMRYSSTKVELKMTAALMTEGVDSVGQANWNSGCIMFGFTKEDFGKSFISQGQQFTITGLKTKNRRYPVIAETSGGKSYKFSNETVKRLIS